METGLSRKYLCKSAVNEEVDSKFFRGLLILFNDLKDTTAHEVLHVVVKIAVGKFVDRGHTFCKDLAVASVRTEDVVVNTEKVRLTYGRRFLTHGKVRRTGVVVLDSVVLGLRLYGIKHRLEFADNSHIVIDTHEIFGREVLLFLCDSFVVLVEVDVRKREFAGFSRFVGIDELTLRHDL